MCGSHVPELHAAGPGAQAPLAAHLSISGLVLPSHLAAASAQPSHMQSFQATALREGAEFDPF
jgi:hypothetical protein